ncbi:hypothetical protein [Chryseobacterium oryctis]|uniref:Apea-like HEPN domain-containing protein n=1 Tax=Chryseobacterium oryctis TaxID=2952618 RepID=A0ABT3HNF7_9FLAO|nr:hypothetical protein [Chryseobacterium oryctis]MCW3161143.1 hypothetical protein [Chryseobacterium oryctis]
MSEIENYKDIQNNPCWVAFLHPYTFIIPDDEKPWEISLEQINNLTYNNGNLIRIVCKITIPNSELPCLVCYDGAIAIPKNKNFKLKENAIIYFSEFFTKLILADFYIEGLDQKDIVSGNLDNNWAIWPTSLGSSYISSLHSKIRMKETSNIDTILLSSPRILKVSELNAKLNIGEQILSKIKNLSPIFLLRGFTEYQYKNWDLVLSNLWITIEQLIDSLWENKFINIEKNNPNTPISNRLKSLKEDNRTWSMSVKLELLFQKRILNEEIYSKLTDCRKVRNKLVHDGKKVEKETAEKIIDIVFYLLKKSSKKIKLKKESILRDFDFSYKKIDFSPNFNAWKNLPDENIIEQALGENITKNAKVKNKK